MTAQQREMLALSYVAYERAKALLACADACQFFASTIAFSVLTFKLPHSVTSFTGFLGLVVGVVVAFIRRRGSALRTVARKARLRAVVHYAFEGSEDPDALQDVRHSLGEKLSALAENAPVDSFWNITKQPGSERLREILLESTWFSQKLFGYAAEVIKKVGFLFILIALALIYFITWYPADFWLRTALRLICVFAYSGVMIDVVGKGNAWRKAEREVADLRVMLEKPLRPELIARALALYQLAAHTAPPIPTFLYKRHKKELERSRPDCAA